MKLKSPVPESEFPERKGIFDKIIGGLVNKVSSLFPSALYTSYPQSESAQQTLAANPGMQVRQMPVPVNQGASLIQAQSQPQPQVQAPAPTPTPLPPTTNKFPDISGSLEGRTIPNPPDLIAQVIMNNFPPEQWANAARVAFLESSYNPSAYNWNPGIPDRNISPSHDYGLFQINSIHFPRLLQEAVGGATSLDELIKVLQDPEVNASVARDIYNRRGETFQPWSASRLPGTIQ